MFVIPAISYLFIEFMGYSVDPEISCNACKLTQTSRSVGAWIGQDQRKVRLRLIRMGRAKGIWMLQEHVGIRGSSGGWSVGFVANVDWNLGSCSAYGYRNGYRNVGLHLPSEILIGAARCVLSYDGMIRNYFV